VKEHPDINDTMCRTGANGVRARHDRSKRLNGRAKENDPSSKPACSDEGVSLDDFHAYMPMHSYIYAPSREMWPGSSVNARIAPILNIDACGTPVSDEDGNQKKTLASAWLDRNRSVEQMTWAPGLPMLIRDRLIAEGGWIRRNKVTCFNLYRPPTIVPGNADEAGLWLDHVNQSFR
jgi:hypothetical protein